MIKTTGFHIHFPGEPDVGIHPAEWQLTGEMEFEDKGDLSAFRNTIRSAFKIFVCGDMPVEVLSFEEAEARIKAENELWEGVEDTRKK